MTDGMFFHGGFTLQDDLNTCRENIVEVHGMQELANPWVTQHFTSDHYMSPPLHTCLEEIARLGEIEDGFGNIVEPRKEKQESVSKASLQLLLRFGSSFRRLNSGKNMIPEDNTTCTRAVRQELSTNEIIRIAEAKFIQTSFNGLTEEDIRNVDLSELLLDSAYRIVNQQFDYARRLLDQCDTLSSCSGNPVQRLAHHLSIALRERIDQETGRVSKGWRKEHPTETCKEMVSASNTIEYYQRTPFLQVLNFAGVQAIVEHVAEARRIHIIDFRIRNGKQWIILMQALASRSDHPLQLLKITAVGTSTKNQYIQSTGERLISFARTMNLPFSFKEVRVSDMTHLTEDDFELDPQETVAVFAEFLMACLIKHPNRLEPLMKVIKNLNPCLMVLTELEADLSSPNFMSRLTAALVYFGALFDCHESCMERDNPARTFGETILLGEVIKCVVATERGETYMGCAKMEILRALFARFGMEETGLSMSALYQANLVLDKVPCWNPCRLTQDGKSLIAEWKGTSIYSLSVWKFTRQQQQHQQ